MSDNVKYQLRLELYPEGTHYIEEYLYDDLDDAIQDAQSYSVYYARSVIVYACRPVKTIKTHRIKKLTDDEA